MIKEIKKMGRPKEYDTDEERKIRSIRVSDPRLLNIKKKYKTLQDFIEDAYEIIIDKSS